MRDEERCCTRSELCVACRLDKRWEEGFAVCEYCGEEMDVGEPHCGSLACAKEYDAPQTGQRFWRASDGYNGR